jgi:hypothetical protein
VTVAEEKALAAKVQELLDRQRIADLVADFCRAIDRCDMALLKSLYWPDATDAHGVYNGSAADFCDMVIPLVRDNCAATMHLIANSRMELRGEEAVSETYVIGYHFLKSARHIDGFLGNPELGKILRARMPPGDWDLPYEYHAGARYLDRLTCRKGEWRFAHRQLVFEWVQTHPGFNIFDQSPGSTLTRGSRDRTDPGYALFNSIKSPNSRA